MIMKRIGCLFCILFASLSALAQADVIISGGWLNTTAAGIYSSAPAAFEQKTNTPTGSLSTTATAMYNGVVNNTTYDYSVSGSAGYLLTTFDHSAAAVDGQYGEPHNQGHIDFTVTGAPVTYFLSGDFGVSGSPYASIETGLRTGKSVLFENYQSSNATMNENFTMGEMGGDHSNTLTGSLTGILGVGTYSLDYTVTSQSLLGGSETAGGFIRLDFGAPAPSPAAVPEPTTLALMGLGLMGLLAARRKF